MMSKRIQQEIDRLSQMGYAVTIIGIDFTVSGDEGLSGYTAHMSEQRLLENDERLAAQQRKKLTVVK